METIFHNPHVSQFFGQMVQGIMDKLEIDETNAGDWFVQYEGDPERHMLHIIDALVGFLGKPHQEFSVSEISKFLAYLQHMLNEESARLMFLILLNSTSKCKTDVKEKLKHGRKSY